MIARGQRLGTGLPDSRTPRRPRNESRRPEDVYPEGCYEGNDLQWTITPQIRSQSRKSSHSPIHE